MPYFIRHFFFLFAKNPLIAIQIAWGYVQIKVFGGSRSFFYKGLKIVYPPKVLGGGAIEEIFVDNFYRTMKGYKNVLDLGGYFGESSLYFSLYNTHVDVYEADPKIYAYMQKNIEQKSNISGVHCAVIATDDTELYFDTGGMDFTMGGHITNQKTDIKIPTKHIKDILSQKNYDGIKIDIEGAEFEVVEWITNNHGREKFLCGYIEFHFFTQEQRDKQGIMYSYLESIKKTHIYTVYDARNNGVTIEKNNLISFVDNTNQPVLFIEFIKK